MKYLIKNSRVVNEGKIFISDVLIERGIISEIGKFSEKSSAFQNAEIINASGKYLLPGVIDDQVHLREPGLTHKEDIYSASKAAVAGGVTSFMDMPNTLPNTITNQLLEEKYSLASEKSLCNFSFYLGATNENLDEVKNMDAQRVCGVKVFMGSSTGNMLVDKKEALENIFSLSNSIIAVHCEDEETIKLNLENIKIKYGDAIPFSAHPLIRSSEACFKSSYYAVQLALRKNTRLHLLHLSTAKEMALLENIRPLNEKRITAEVCVHHLWFTDKDYESKGSMIKWNPAIKTKADRTELWRALLDGRIDVIATDHAPHTLQEKQNPYLNAPSGGPLLQHSLPVMLEFYHRKKISLKQIVQKMAHAPALCFNIEKRGFIRKGYHADLILVDLNDPWMVSKENVLYKCGWSPFEGVSLQSRITHTFVNGVLVFENGKFHESCKGQRLLFNRQF